MKHRRYMTRDQTSAIYRASGPDEPALSPLDRRRRELCDRRVTEHRAFVEAKRRAGLLETTVEHLTAQLAEAKDALARLGEVHRLSIGETIRLNLARDMPRLRARHPEGVLLCHLVEHFGFEKAIIRLTLTEMAREGRVRWVPIKGRHELSLLLPGEEAPVGLPPPLTASRQRTLDLLLQHAEGSLVGVSMRDLARGTGNHPSTFNYDIQCLLRDKRLFLVERGQAGRPSVYAFEPPEKPLALTPSQERWVGEGPRYPRVRKLAKEPGLGVLAEVSDRSREPRRIVAEEAQPDVAVVAEQGADTASIVTLIDVEGASAAGLVGVADGAGVSLAFEHRVELDLGHAVAALARDVAPVTPEKRGPGRPRTRVADNMPVEFRRPVLGAPRTVTARLMGDPVEPARRPDDHDEPLDRDGLWLQREAARCAR
jgi:hypothetical protein